MEQEWQLRWPSSPPHWEADFLCVVLPTCQYVLVVLEPGRQVSHCSPACSVPHGQQMFSERLGWWELVARPEGRAAFVGTVLAALQGAGFVMSLYLLIRDQTIHRWPDSTYVGV